MNILFLVGALKISFLSTLISRQSTPVRPLHGGLNRYLNNFSLSFLWGVYAEGNLLQRCKKTRDGGVFFSKIGQRKVLSIRICLQQKLPFERVKKSVN